jgi:glycerate dehydrogenase
MAVIVITDGYTLNPGDLNWERFKSLGEVVLYDRSPSDLVMERCRDADVIITNKTPITAKVIEASLKLKVIAVTATGYNVVDIQASKKKGIPVCNVPAYGTDSVAQHTFALLLELTNQVGRNSESVRAGDWVKSKDWCYAKSPIVELAGKTFGIVGYGRIGQKVATIADAFGMSVIYHSTSSKGVTGVSVTLDDVFRQSDVISLHIPLNEHNHGFVNRDLLSLMKPSAFLINTSRGQLIHETDLSRFLWEGKIAGAALDVLSVEPPAEDNPLIAAPHCIITPHNAWLSIEARKRIMDTTFNNVKLALEGKSQNIVNW